MHQGWPKLGRRLWMRTPEGRLAAVAYAPSEARFEAKDTPVSVVLDADYPFRETLEITVKAGSGARFPLSLRVPEWAKGAVIRVGDRTRRKRCNQGRSHRLEREWKGDVRIGIRFPMAARLTG